MRVIEDTPRPIREINPDIPDWLADIIGKLHAKKPADRYQSAREVADVLEQRLAELQAHGRVLPTEASKPAPGRSWKAAVLVGLLLLGVIGATVALWEVIRIQGEQGEYVIDTDDPDFSFRVHKGAVTLEDRKTGRKYDLKVVREKGQDSFELEVTDADAGLEFRTKTFTIKRGERVALKAWFERKLGVDGQWLKRVAALPAKEQVAGVCAKLKDLNPGSDGIAEHKIEDGVVTEITVVTDKVTDISPLRVFNALRVLDCSGIATNWKGNGQLADLTPLKGMNLAGLTKLNLAFTKVGDAGLAHFKDCKSLTFLWLNGTKVTDLSTLRGLPLKNLWCDFEYERDAEILRSINTLETINGKPVKEFWKGYEAKNPFVVLARDGRAEQPFPTLKDAVEKAQSGDTIEIRGDGPFPTPSLMLGNKALRIQAGTGYRPHLTLSAEDAQVKYYFLHTQAALVLEGLTIERLATEPIENKGNPHLVVSQSASGPLHVSHCRFLCRNSWCISAWSLPGFIVQHSEFQVPGETAVGVTPPLPGEYVLENCLVCSTWGGFGLNWDKSNLGDVRLRIRRNTFVCAQGLGYGAYLPLKDIIDKRPDPKVPELRLELTENVIDADRHCWCIAEQKGTPLPLDECLPLVPRLFALTDERNVYSHPESVFLTLPRKEEWLIGAANLEGWNKLWGIAKPTSLEGVVRFEGGDLRKKGLAGQFVPADFRLVAGSPGKGKGKDGKDLGADVDRVGPGKPYEDWKKTPDYQEWRKKTEAMLQGQQP